MPYTSQFTGPEIDARLTQAQTNQAEIVAARGGRATLGERITNISNFTSPNAGGVIPGRFYDTAFGGASAGSLAGVAGRIDLMPFFTSFPFTFDQIGVNVSTAAAGNQGRVAIYGTTAAGWPGDRLFVGATALDMSGTGLRVHAQTFTFEPGRSYWMGYHASGTATVTALALSSMKNLGLMSGTSTGASAYATVCRQIIPFGDGPPATWVFNETHLISVAAASIRMRAV